MNKDVRISTNAPHHRKIRLLEHRLGATGCWAWVQLLCYAGRERIEGRFTDAEEINAAVNWRGRTNFVGVLIEIGLLDESPGGGLQLHDWKEHNEYASHAVERSERQRLIAHQKHCKGAGRCKNEYCPNSSRSGGSSAENVEQMNDDEVPF